MIIKSNINSVWINRLTLGQNEKKRNAIELEFPFIKNSNNKLYLSLYKYLSHSPEKFFSKDAKKSYTLFLSQEYKNNKTQLLDILNQHQKELSKAFYSLEEINQYDWHDSLLDIEEYELVRFCDDNIHHTYLKLVEGIYFHFMLLLAKLQRLNRQKSTDGLDIYNCVEEVNNSTFSILCKPYKQTVRNGIGHGDITYQQRIIKYKDKKRVEILSVREIIELVDNLLDYCNGMALALKLFYIKNFSEEIKLPQQIMIEELQAETSTPYWNIEGSLISEFNETPQLIIYAKAYTRDYFKVFHAAFSTGVLAEYFASGFDRYFLSIRSPFAYPGWAGFDGKKLNEFRISKNTINAEDYLPALENKVILYIPHTKLPSWLSFINTLYYSFLIHWYPTIEEIKTKRGLISFTVKTAKIHRNGWRSVLNGSVVIDSKNNTNIQDQIRNSCRHIISESHKVARKLSNLTDSAKYIPLGYARILIFRKDYRKRKLNNYGLGKDLICTIQIKKISRIKAPDIYGSTVEFNGQ